MCALNDPSSGFEARVFLALNFFGTTRLCMRFVMPSLEKIANRFGVVSFIQTHVLVAISRLTRRVVKVLKMADYGYLESPLSVCRIRFSINEILSPS